MAQNPSYVDRFPPAFLEMGEALRTFPTTTYFSKSLSTRVLIPLLSRSSAYHDFKFYWVGTTNLLGSNREHHVVYSIVAPDPPLNPSGVEAACATPRTIHVSGVERGGPEGCRQALVVAMRYFAHAPWSTFLEVHADRDNSHLIPPPPTT